MGINKEVKNENQTETELVPQKVYLRLEEKKQIKESAKHHNLSISSYIRERLGFAANTVGRKPKNKKETKVNIIENLTPSKDQIPPTVTFQNSKSKEYEVSSNSQENTSPQLLIDGKSDKPFETLEFENIRSDISNTDQLNLPPDFLDSALDELNKIEESK